MQILVLGVRIFISFDTIQICGPLLENVRSLLAELNVKSMTFRVNNIVLVSIANIFMTSHFREFCTYNTLM